MSDEKTEAPTAKKKKESRKEGQVPRTQELGAWAALLAFGLVLRIAGGHEMKALMTLMERCFTVVEDPTVDKAMTLLGDATKHMMLVVVALGFVVMLIGVGSAIAQGGFYLATKSVKPKFSKLNPISGAKRIFGTQALWEAVKILVKSTVLGVIVYSAIKAMVPLIGGLVQPSVTMELALSRIVHLLQTVAIAGLVMAVADYAFQRKKMGKQTRMTKHEVKQEHKNSEGDPQIKGAIRARQMAAARSRMMADVGLADVVLVNPTHVAVALKYDPAAGAPRVVAKGAGAIAAKIREKAAEADVPLVRDVPLARSLYSSCKVGQEIPAELFAAVAQVLAFVISRRTQGRRGGSHDTPRAAGALPVLARARRR